jgi:hypothetical protein
MTRAPPQTLAEAAAPLLQVRRWVRALAVVQFVLAGLTVLTVIGVVVAWVFFWIGWVLWQAAHDLDRAAAAGEALDGPLHAAMERLAFQFLLQVAFALAVLGVMFLAGFGRGLAQTLLPAAS